MTRYYQDNTRISTNSNARVTQGVEGGNNISQTRIQIHKKTPQLQDKYENKIWRMRSAHGHWKV